ncbi:HNH endonuclease [Deefgea piscis]|uniref:HNH endonuclease n=1 Tax=Deefgea piscis TaxID=2739061 RepID=UPI001C815095|nr:HNH endonuclease [Deefgea piscis]QZA82564.1 HNH endonuclease [Deefgea piscis]
MTYYFAYHGPENDSSFDYLGGYGVKTKSKLKKISIGDQIFIIQKLKNHSTFELCGLFAITETYDSPTHKDREYRVKLTPVIECTPFLALNEEELSIQLPETPENGSNKGWSNFKRHFCTQGGSLSTAISADVLAVLNAQLNPRSVVFTLPDEIENPSSAELIEGSVTRVMVNAYERNPEARKACLKHWGHQCAVCNFHFELFYGDIGKKYIHVHHLKAISSIGKEYVIDPINDLRPVCPNCHAMLHQQNPPLSIEELEKRVKLYGKRPS